MDPYHMLAGNDNDKRYSMVESEVVGMNQGKAIIRQRVPSVARTPRSGSDFERIFDALVAYKNIHGDVKVPQKFKIPNPSPDFPVEMWGMNLGKTLHNIRYKHCHASYKPRLLELGVDYEIIRKKPRRVNGPPGSEYDPEHRRKIMKTNQEFDAVYDPNDFKNDMSFSGLVVNYDSDESDMEDDALDRAYNQVAGNSMMMHPSVPAVNPAMAAAPQQLVHKRKKSSSNGFDIIYKCLLVYKELNGHLMVPKRFVIPESGKYPQEAWGMKIGHSVCNIRNIGSYSEHRDKLEAIGFTFKSSLNRPVAHPVMMVGPAAGGVGVGVVGVVPDMVVQQQQHQQQHQQHQQHQHLQQHHLQQQHQAQQQAAQHQQAHLHQQQMQQQQQQQHPVY